ncbi:MAG: methionyl-tRNA formyltransferase [Bacteroidetes bacterium]|nr:methionyl-tRNA formyltransferase [Bacteroidota bacterium]
MNIVFMGTPEFAVPSLQILLANNYNVSAVVTAPDKPRGRGQQVSFTPIKTFALQHKIHVLQPEKLNDEKFLQPLKQLHPDLFVVVAFRILPKEVYTIPSRGAFNLHASLLPKYRGAAPINWAIINGEKESGVTSFFLQEKVDTGNIILQARTAVRPEMNAGELHDVLSEIGAEIVLQTVRLIELGRANPRAQENELASPAPKIFKETCRIDWNQPSEKIHNLIRGLSPYPAAWTMLEGKQIKIFQSKIFHNRFPIENISAGEIAITENSLLVKTKDSALEILEIQQEGKKRMSVEDFLRGFKFTSAKRFM